jgi:3-oxoacyl-[acyl-carrier-protein] synthase II
MDRFAMLKSLTNLAAGHLSIQFQLKGPSTTVNTACASGQTAVGEAFHLIRRGDADVMVAGGAEEGVQPFLLAGFNKIGALNADENGHPEGASRPFDQHRKGFVLGEGAGALILEELEHALSRKAKIYAEVLGFASTVEAEYLTRPSEDGDGTYRAMIGAMKQAGIEAKDVDMVKAHGTGSEDGDVAEITAILRIFKTPGPVITANKGSIGHLLGAAGAVEAAFAALSVHNDTIPPMINLKHPLELYAGTLKPNYARALLKQKVTTVLTNAFGFGGVNTSLVLAKHS